MQSKKGKTMSDANFSQKKVAIFTDTSNLYHKVQRKFATKLCYDAYYALCTGFGSIIKAIAYGMQINSEAGGFINCLKIAGFETKFKRPRILTFGDHQLKFCNWDSVMTMDIIELIGGGGLDIIIIGSSNLDLIPLIKWIRSRGIFVVIFASDVPSVFYNIVDRVIEITENELEDEDEDETFEKDDSFDFTPGLPE